MNNFSLWFICFISSLSLFMWSLVAYFSLCLCFPLDSALYQLTATRNELIITIQTRSELCSWRASRFIWESQHTHTYICNNILHSQSHIYTYHRDSYTIFIYRIVNVFSMHIFTIHEHDREKEFCGIVVLVYCQYFGLSNLSLLHCIPSIYTHMYVCMY